MTELYDQSRAASVTATAQVLLPIIRRTLPTIIANDLIGVQPMTGAFAGIFSGSNGRSTFQQQGRILRNGYPGRINMEKIHYQHFLKVYNRRTRHHPEYLTGLGYQKIRLTRRDDVAHNANNALSWCKKTLKPGSYVYSSGDFWFAYDRDAMLFSLRWGS